MRASIIALAAAAAAVVPPAALAQNPAAERNLENRLRAAQTQEQLRQYQQQAPAAAQAEQRLNDLDQRVRTQQNADAVTPPVQPTLRPVDVSPASITGGINLSAQSTLMAKELSAENDRLRQLNPSR
jgi:hypothetical protein